MDPVAEESDGEGGVGIEEGVRAEPRRSDRLLTELRTHVGKLTARAMAMPTAGTMLRTAQTGPAS